MDPISKTNIILIFATAVDILSSLFPVTHAVVVVENNNNRFWFLKYLYQITFQNQVKEFLELNNFTVLSACQKGLIEGSLPFPLMYYI